MHIRVSDLSHSYPNGIEALRGVTLEIGAGAQLVLLGQNGAGKTTLVKHLNGLLKPTRGTVLVGEKNTRASTIAQLARDVGFVFQNPDDQLFKTNVRDEVAFGPQNLRLEPSEINLRVQRALEVCELTNVRDTHPYDLPPWQRRWVAIASVVAMQTRVVVLDEPTTGQDADGLRRLSALLEFWRQEGVTVVAVTHDVDFAVEEFPDLVVMAQGLVLARGGSEILADEKLVEQAALDAPQLMRLARALGLNNLPATMGQFLDSLRAR